MLEVIARHFCLIFITNINDFDFAELLMVIFVEKALDVEQNARGYSRGLKKVFIFMVFLNQKLKNVETALDVDQTTKGHSSGLKKVSIFVRFLNQKFKNVQKA